MRLIFNCFASLATGVTLLILRDAAPSLGYVTNAWWLLAIAIIIAACYVSFHAMYGETRIENKNRWIVGPAMALYCAVFISAATAHMVAYYYRDNVLLGGKVMKGSGDTAPGVLLRVMFDAGSADNELRTSTYTDKNGTFLIAIPKPKSRNPAGDAPPVAPRTLVTETLLGEGDIMLDSPLRSRFDINITLRPNK
jgi:hypothetical protein